jgi:hypothetical protein
LANTSPTRPSYRLHHHMMSTGAGLRCLKEPKMSLESVNPKFACGVRDRPNCPCEEGVSFSVQSESRY